MDETILLWVNGHYNDFLDAFMPVMTHRFAWIPMYIAIAYAVFRTLAWRDALLFLLAVALTTVLADQIGASLIRPAVARLRPSNVDNPLSAVIHIVDGYRGGAYGMPSCHAANTVGLLTLLLLRFRGRLFHVMMVTWVIMQVYSRMYLGVHYPTDILAGAALGFCCAVLSYYIYVRASIKLLPAVPQREPLRKAAAPLSLFVLSFLAMTLWAAVSM